VIADRQRRRASGPAARSTRSWPLLVVVIGVAAGLGVSMIGEDTWRLGCLIIGAFLGVGAVTRVVLPPGDAGLLQVRGKTFDAVALGVTAVAIIALAIAVPAGR
jgi:hypothetical protein